MTDHRSHYVKNLFLPIRIEKSKHKGEEKHQEQDRCTKYRKAVPDKTFENHHAGRKDLHPAAVVQGHLFLVFRLHFVVSDLFAHFSLLPPQFTRTRGSTTAYMMSASIRLIWVRIKPNME